MVNFLLRRLSLGLAIILVAMATLYVLILAAPGDPATVMLGPRATPATIAAIHQRLGLDQPLPVQVVKFVASAVTGDFGQSLRSRRPVLGEILAVLPHTLALIACSLLLSVAIGIPIGCAAAIYRNGWIDRISSLLSLGVISVPAVVLAIYGMLIFAVWLRWLPAIGVGNDPLSVASHLVLPVVCTALGWIGYISRLVRASLLEILNEPHVRNARAFGLPEGKIIRRYALRLAIAPTITVIGTGVGYMLGNAVFAEIVFARPGIGKLMYDAIAIRNYPVTMGVAVVSTMLIVIAVAVADFVNAMIDPRLREARE